MRLKMQKCNSIKSSNKNKKFSSWNNRRNQYNLRRYYHLPHQKGKKKVCTLQFRFMSLNLKEFRNLIFKLNQKKIMAKNLILILHSIINKSMSMLLKKIFFNNFHNSNNNNNSQNKKNILEFLLHLHLKRNLKLLIHLYLRKK